MYEVWRSPMLCYCLPKFCQYLISPENPRLTRDGRAQMIPSESFGVSRDWNAAEYTIKGGAYRLP